MKIYLSIIESEPDNGEAVQGWLDEDLKSLDEDEQFKKLTENTP